MQEGHGDQFVTRRGMDGRPHKPFEDKSMGLSRMISGTRVRMFFDGSMHFGTVLAIANTGPWVKVVWDKPVLALCENQIVGVLQLVSQVDDVDTVRSKRK